MDTKQQGHLAGLLKLTRQLSSTPPSDTGTTTSVVGRCPAALLRGWSFAQAARDTFGRFSCTAKLRWTMRERGAENTVSGWPRPNAQPRDERAANHMGKCSAHKNDTYACAAHTWRTARGVSAYGSGRWRERAQLAPFSPLSATAPPPLLRENTRSLFRGKAVRFILWKCIWLFSVQQSISREKVIILLLILIIP